MSTIFGAKKYYFLHRFTLDKTIDILYNSQAVADLAHLVERHLAKVEVASSSLVIRSILNTVKHRYIPVLYFFADVLLLYKNKHCIPFAKSDQRIFFANADKAENPAMQKALNQAAAKADSDNVSRPLSSRPLSLSGFYIKNNRRQAMLQTA